MVETLRTAAGGRPRRTSLRPRYTLAPSIHSAVISGASSGSRQLRRVRFRPGFFVGVGGVFDTDTEGDYGVVATDDVATGFLVANANLHLAIASVTNPYESS